ncbi:AAA family ATPase [Microbacterium horticulturae]|uniref:AAA family ATPase n=1 Tax=Microbacterium horticulturae TaxID=3028316 RepID=A0ABY8BZ35_9MICO|nr:helix-turn-helix transcriptional regulator [Microbacterium sp. KACC 23027]WEG09471.1 AAA family ATPase [Microbacterium sp. KACC 23027]
MAFTATSSATTTPMVGRDAELARLDALFARAESGQPTAVVIAGEAGMGKSRLIREFAASVVDRADVATGRALDFGGTPAPYGAVLGLLRDLATQRGADELWRAAGPGRAALLLLMPELAESPEIAASTPPSDTQPTPERLREAFVTAVESLAESRPLVLVLEDLHWADEGTLTLLSFLLRVVTRGRLLVVLGWRSDEGRRADPVRLFIGEAERAHLLERVALRRLDHGSVQALVTALGGADDSDSVERLDERAEGVPFFIEELACCADGPLPDTLRDVLLTRYGQLWEDAAAAVRVISASDAPLEHDTLVALTGFDDERLNAAIREAVGTGILIVDDDRYTFRHALLREAVHAELLPGEHAALHRAYAELLQSRMDADPRRDLHAALAHHWRHAHERRRALVAAVAAMLSAKSRYAFSTAARFGRMVLELWDQVDDPEAAAGMDRITLMQRIASILRNAGEIERALAVVDRALDEASRTDVAPALHARLLRDKAVYHVNLGRPGATALLNESLRVIDDAQIDDPELSAGVLNLLAARLMVAGRHADAVEMATRSADVALRIGSDQRLSVALNVRGASRAHGGDVAGGLADYAAARELARDQSAQLRYDVNYSDLLTVLGRYHEALSVAEEGLERARAVGQARTTGSILIQNMVQPLLELGEIDRVDELLARDLELRTFPVFRIYTTTSRARALSWHGHPEAAATLLRQQRSAIEDATAFERQVWSYGVHARLAIAQAAGDRDAARAIVREILDDDGERTAHLTRLLLEASAVIATLRAHGEDVDDLVARVAEAWDALPAALRPAPWQRILAAFLRPHPDALTIAVESADDPDMPATFCVTTRLELARSLVAAGRRAEAVPVLAEARTVAESLAHEPLRREVTAFAEAVGLTEADGDPDAALAELTARERQVLELIAEGLSNGQIAQRLFISVKTASVHVSAILRKLGVSSRTEAAVLATRELA